MASVAVLHLGIAFCVLSPSQSSADEALRIVVPATTAYFEPFTAPTGFNREGRIVRWEDPAVKVMWFGELKKTGDVRAIVQIKGSSDKESTFQLTVAGQSREKTYKPGEAKETDELDFGEFKIEKPGYQSFTLEWLGEKGKTPGEVESLTLSGSACADAHFNLLPRRNAASIHLSYPKPKKGDVTGFYCEATAIDSPVQTFFMVGGFGRGYLGMQVNGPTERRIIFSVWDSGRGASARDRKEIDDRDRVTQIAVGENMHVNAFGGEGTGMHSHLKCDWKTGEKQKFFVTAAPDDGGTIYTGYYFHPEQQKWVLLASFKAPHDGGYLNGLYSFSENFSGTTGHLRRAALFGNQWVQYRDGEWVEQLEANFTCDGTGDNDRFDRYMAVQENQFLLSHGGFIEGFTRHGDKMRREPLSKAPEIVLPPLVVTPKSPE